MTSARVAVAITIGLTACTTHSVQRVSYPDGNRHWEYELTNGIPDGSGVVFHPNGAIRSEGNYSQGVKHGLFSFTTRAVTSSIRRCS